MKINFNKITQIIKKYKYIIFLFIVIVIFFYNSSSIVEGFTDNIGEYEYLAPPPPLDNVDDETWKRFISKYFDAMIDDANKSTSDPVFKERRIKGLKDNQKKLDDNNHLQLIINHLKKDRKYDGNVTKQEIDYYINNGKLPYNGYVMNKLSKDNSNMIKDLQREMAPNRLVYARFIYDRDESKQNPLPLSAKIYLGQEKPPSTSSTIITDDISAIKSNSNYSELVSLCKKVMRN